MEVTVIAPNVVEFAGNLARQSAPIAERFIPPPPPPPPKSETPLKPRDEIGEQSRRLAANKNLPASSRSASKPESPGEFRLIAEPRNRLGQPSTQFLAQQIAQESRSSLRPGKPFPSVLAAYERSRPQRPKTDSEPTIITRRVNLLL